MKFTLRDLFWLMLVTGLSVGWFLDHRRHEDGERIAAVQSRDRSPAGVVMTVNTTNLVEVSMGSDDGLKAGQEMVVYRGKQFLGQITISSLTPDRAVGAIDKSLQRGKIVQGDIAKPIWKPGEGPIFGGCGSW
jgi:hypothetical protein